MKTDSDAIIRLIRDYGVLSRSVVDPERSLKEQGMDSLGFATLVFALEERFGIKLPPELLPRIESVAGIVEAVAELWPDSRPGV